jgi:hypothetical protein
MEISEQTASQMDQLENEVRMTQTDEQVVQSRKTLQRRNWLIVAAELSQQNCSRLCLRAAL